jgi:hypothetical protein
MPIYWGPEHRTWTTALGGTFLPYDNEVQPASLDGQALPATRIAHAALFEAGLAKQSGKQFRAEPFFALPEMFEHAVAQFGSREQAFARIMLDSRDETMMLVQACAVLNCANVGTTTIEPHAALRKKRLASGKQPFFSYKVLQLTGEGRADQSSAAGGTHASPRMHLRRGHLRRLPSKVIWVRPTMVGASSESGFVVKDYALVAPPTAPGA